MKLYQVVLKDVIRRKRRVLYATLGVIIGTATVVGILTVARAGQEKIYNQLEKYGPNLAVIPSINNLDMKLGDVKLGMLAVGDNYVSEEKLPLIRQIADGEIRKALKIDDPGNIATIAPNLYIDTKIKDLSVMVVGIDPQEEIKIKTWWKVKDGKYLETNDQALAGSTAAEILDLKLGDVIPLDGTNVTITGILEQTGSNDDYQLFVPLGTLQKASGREGLVSSVDIRALCNACPVETIADGINRDVPGVRAVAVKQIAESEMGIMEKMNKFMLTLAGITLAVGLFGVVNTMMTSVNERVKDIGIMRAVGASRSQIVKAFIYEAIIIGVVGGILGYVLGTLLAFIAGPLVFEGSVVALVPQYFIVALILAIAVAVVATIYPAIRATQIKVADSFRSL